jgi:hypothetical protein
VEDILHTGLGHLVESISPWFRGFYEVDIRQGMTAGKLRTGQRVDVKEGCLDLIDRGIGFGKL